MLTAKQAETLMLDLGYNLALLRRINTENFIALYSRNGVYRSAVISNLRGGGAVCYSSPVAKLKRLENIGFTQESLTERLAICSELIKIVENARCKQGCRTARITLDTINDSTKVPTRKREVK